MSKVLSLLQPWASLVVAGYKTVETRSWTTAYRGNLLIHASKSRAGIAVARQSPDILHLIGDFNSLPFGAIIGEAELFDVIRIGETNMPINEFELKSLEEKVFGEYLGRYAWMLRDTVEWAETIPARGHQGLWEY